MTTTITPVPRYDEVALTRAVAGERMMMDGGAAPLAGLLQKFADRDAFARDALIANLSWSGEFSVAPGGTNSVFDVTLGAIYVATLYDVSAGTWRSYTVGSSTIGAGTIEGGGNLAPSSWYYVYIFAGGGGIQAEISLTAPNASRVHKSGSAAADLARRYMGCFRTDSTGAPFPMRMTRGRALYRRSAIGSAAADLASDGLRALDSAGVHVAASLDLSSRLPPHARVAILSGEIVATSSGSSGTASLNLFAANDTTVVGHAITANASAVSGDTSRNSSLVEIETTSAQVARYSVTKTTDLSAYTLDVMGWYE